MSGATGPAPVGDRVRAPVDGAPGAVDDEAAGRPRRRTPGLGVLQRLGRSLMLPIAALPVAALLLRLGQPDMLGDGDSGLALGSPVDLARSRSPTCWPRPAASLFSHLGLLFAVGVASGSPASSDGSTALAAVVGYLVFDAVTTAMSPYVLDPAATAPPRG